MTTPARLAGLLQGAAPGGAVPAGAVADTVGAGLGYVATYNNTNSATGSFLRITGLTSENDNGANNFSLQVNSNVFNTSACNSHPNCKGWQQFIFDNSGSGGSVVFIQYWLANYGTSCPLGWTSDGATSCFMDSNTQMGVASQPISNLANLKLEGQEIPGAQIMDKVTLFIGTSATAVSQVQVLGLLSLWNQTEFNIFGSDGNNPQATFNAGTTLVVGLTLNNNTRAAPGCLQNVGMTAETNNLTVVDKSCCPLGVPGPSIVFSESNASPIPLPYCREIQVLPALALLGHP